MTKAKFKKWVEQHYTDLLRVTKTLEAVRVGAVEPQDAVQAGIERVLRTRNYERCRTKPLSWIMHSVKSVVANGFTSRGRAYAAYGALHDILTDGTFRLGNVKPNKADGLFQCRRPLASKEAFPSPEELLTTPEEREAEQAEWQAARAIEAQRRADQDLTRQWDKQLARVTWFHPDGRVAATSDPLQTAGNLRTCTTYRQ